MAEDSPKYNPTFEDEVKSAVVGEKNIIYNYFYYREDVRDKPVESEETTASEKPPCPYRGLFHFGPNDAAVFFGRQVFVEKLFQATQTRNFIPVLGASGSGKSSVVLAGLVPKLEQEGNWKFTHFRPSSGNDPFYALAEALVPLYRSDLDSTDRMTQSGKLAKSLSEGELSLAKVFSNIQRQHPNHKVLLIADQFEELYTQYSDLKFRRRFLDCLLASFQYSNSGSSSSTVLVATMRADFLANALSYRPFADMLQNADIKLGAMSREELTEVIEKPAQLRGVRLEPGLKERILEAVEDEPGYLPLLEFALTLLWAKQQNGQLTHQAYEDIGGVEKALAEYAEEQYESLSEEDKQKAQRVFIQLVHPGTGTEDTRKLATRDEVGEDNWDLVTRLASARLVVTNKTEKTDEKEETDQETVEIMHEALIREWGTLRDWMKVNREFRTWQERLKLRMKEKELLQGSSLAVAEDWFNNSEVELSQAERDFIARSIDERERQIEQKRRASRILLTGISAVAVIIGGLGIFSWFQKQEAEVQTKLAQKQALIAELRENTARVKNLLNSPYRVDGLVLAISAANKSKQRLGKVIPVVEKASLEANQIVREKNLFLGHRDNVGSVAFSPDGQYIVSGSSDTTIRLWDKEGNQIGEPFQGHTHFVISVAFSPDGQYIVSGSVDNTIRLWDKEGNQIGEPFLGHRDSVDSVAFSPDGQYIVSGSRDDTIRLWDKEGNQIGEPFLGHRDNVGSVAFSPDGQYIVSGSEDNTIRLWDKEGNQIGEPFQGHTHFVKSVAFSPDGQYIVSGSWDGTIRLWEFGWKNWLKSGCNQLKDHPVLKNPQTEEQKEAQEACFKYADWSKELMMK